MVKKFEFGSSRLDLDIAGNTFSISVADAGLAERLSRFGEEAIERSQNIRESEDVARQLAEACDFCDRTLDGVLGGGASEKIFSGREKDLFERIEVMNFLIDEINAFREERLQKYSPNRAARRVKK
ncbi:DUF6673 family protein [Anaerotruncus rubiinfantis]|uniref:DUF6673 family protein n=1 Tax=Anaerotruncus rubiinfantis TaxID=1720200 RepID=UPI0018998B02|nr:DUF6673 family protein [Anaerotruncus rubiinfantis]